MKVDFVKAQIVRANIMQADLWHVNSQDEGAGYAGRMRGDDMLTDLSCSLSKDCQCLKIWVQG